MKINRFLICLGILSVNIIIDSAFADSQTEVVTALEKDMQQLKANQNNLTVEERAAEANKIFNKLEDKTTGDDKLLVSIVNQEVKKFTAKAVEYDKFLNKIADPAFFNLKNAEDPANLQKQLALAKDYVSVSKEMSEYTNDYPIKIRKALEAKHIKEESIKATMQGFKDSEAKAKKTPAIVFAKRVEHAEVLLKGLEYLKAWKGNWNFDDTKGIVKFKNADNLNAWKKEVADPLDQIEKFLTS